MLLSEHRILHPMWQHASTNAHARARFIFQWISLYWDSHIFPSGTMPFDDRFSFHPWTHLTSHKLGQNCRDRSGYKSRRILAEANSLLDPRFPRGKEHANWTSCLRGSRFCSIHDILSWGSELNVGKALHWHLWSIHKVPYQLIWIKRRENQCKMRKRCEESARIQSTKFFFRESKLNRRRNPWRVKRSILSEHRWLIKPFLRDLTGNGKEILGNERRSFWVHLWFTISFLEDLYGVKGENFWDVRADLLTRLTFDAQSYLWRK